MTENPSRFDSIESQMALARHTAGTSGAIVCISCVHRPVETMRTFWTTLTPYITVWKRRALRIRDTD